MANRLPTPDIMGAVLAAKADAPEMIALFKIKRDGGTQMRAGLDEPTVTEYFDAMTTANAWGSFPALVVFHDGENYWLADGFHRYAAAIQTFGASYSAPCDVRAGTQRDAMLHAASANASHGLRRTNADKRRAVLALLQDPEWSQWSDGEIAKRCAVSQPFVSGLRKDFAPERHSVIVRLPDAPDEDEDETTHNGYESPAPAAAPAPATRKGSDGREYKVKPATPNYAQIWQLEGAAKLIYGGFYREQHERRTAPQDMRASAKIHGGAFWNRLVADLDERKLTYRVSDLVQAINNFASRMEQSQALAKVDEGKVAQEIKYLSDVEAIIVEWHRGGCDIFLRPEASLISEIIDTCKYRNFTISSDMAGAALVNARNSIVADKAVAARAAAPTPAPVSLENGKNLVDWTEDDFAEAQAKAVSADVAAANQARTTEAGALIDLYQRVIDSEAAYSRLTGNFVTTIRMQDVMRKMQADLERLVADLQ
jgi:hypothetical protein